MEKRAPIQKILAAAQGQSVNIKNAANGVGWMGQSSGVQQQVGEAIVAWTEHNDPEPLLGVLELMQTLDIIVPKEADEIRDEIIAANGRAKHV